MKLESYCDACGNCSRCGECCASLLPITRAEEKRIREYIKDNNIEPEKFKVNNNSINLQCCFFDRTKKVCKIYKVRPSICRSFKCNKSIDLINKNKEEHHKRAYWNYMLKKEIEHLTDMRLLFYNDPSSLVGNLVFTITDGEMVLNKKQFKFIKEILIKGGQAELANSMRGIEDESRYL